MSLKELKKDINTFEQITNESKEIRNKNIILPLNIDDNYTISELTYYKTEFASMLEQYLSKQQFQSNEKNNYLKIKSLYKKYSNLK